MSVRTDITFDWEVSPRKVTVDAPSVEFTMQDVLDTLRHNESLSQNMDNQQIVNGNGKVILDAAGNATGLTVQLINATVGFEARDGTEQGGTNDWTECSLSGGNLSGLETDGTTVTTQVTHNNSFVNINKTSSVSATISESKTNEVLAYDNILHFDAGNVNGTGRLYPVGTSANPVNNVADGVALAAKYFLATVYTHSDITMDRDVSKFNVVGQTPDLLLNPNGFKMDLCSINSMNINGDFNDSLIHIYNSEIINALNIYGKIKDSYLIGTTLISANQDLTITDSESGVAGQGSPTIDMKSNEDTTLSLRVYSGGLTLENCDTPACVTTMSFVDGGKPHLEPSCTDGYISIRGSGFMDDRSDGSIIDDSAFIHADYVTFMKNIAEGDMIPTLADWKILHKTTKVILVNKNTNKVGDLTQLIEP